MKVRILTLDKYTRDNRDIKLGEVYLVHLKSKRVNMQSRETHHYLIEDKKKRPITMYSHQVEELN